ncbi:MAG: M16 family metallopeptidase, partial [Candidatus Bipolaricaulaceae bacterium]
VSRIECEDLWRFFGRHYHPKGMIFVACGGVDPERVFSLAEKFSGKAASGNPVVRTPPQPRAGLTLAERDINQVHLVLGFPTVPASAPERYALEVLNAVLGGGVSSRLFQRLREELGLVYAVFSATAYFSDAGVISIYAAAEERKLPQVVEAIWAEVEGLRRAPPKDEDVKRAVQRLCNAFLLSLDDPSGRMVRLGTLAALGRRPLSPEEVIRRFGQVTPEAVQELARRFLSVERAAWAAVGPSGERIRQALRPFAEVV